MMPTDRTRPTPSPHWNAGRVLFEIPHRGDAVPCPISKRALEDIAGRRFHKPDDLLACFLAARVRIERLAAAKLRARPDGASGRPSLWADDVEPDEDPSGVHPDAALRPGDAPEDAAHPVARPLIVGARIASGGGAAAGWTPVRWRQGA